MWWNDLDFTNGEPGSEGDWLRGISPLSPQEEAALTLQALGLSEFEGREIVVDINNVKDITELRATRFESITDAVYWLVDTGLIYIGGEVVTLKDGEVTVKIPTNTPPFSDEPEGDQDEASYYGEPEDEE